MMECFHVLHDVQQYFLIVPSHYFFSIDQHHYVVTKVVLRWFEPKSMLGSTSDTNNDTMNLRDDTTSVPVFLLLFNQPRSPLLLASLLIFVEQLLRCFTSLFLLISVFRVRHELFEMKNFNSIFRSIRFGVVQNFNHSIVATRPFDLDLKYWYCFILPRSSTMRNPFYYNRLLFSITNMEFDFPLDIHSEVLRP